MNREHERNGNDEEQPIVGLRQLDLSAELSHDLWPGIEARLTPRRRRISANGWMSLAAAACVTVIVGLALVPAHPVQPASTVDTVASAADAPDLRAVAGGRALVKANLQLSRRSETQIRRALQQDPDSASLHRLLLNTRARSKELRRMLAAQAT